MLPKDFPPWRTVRRWFRRFVRLPPFRTIATTGHDVASMLDRERVGRGASPTGGVLDSRSVKAPAARQRGFDGGKKITGRERHVAADTDGRLPMINLTTADISDPAGARMILDASRERRPWLKPLLADGARDRGQLMDKAAFLDFVIEIVGGMEGQKGFRVPPRRRVARANLWPDDAVAASGARLRAAHRRLRGHDAGRHGQPHAQAYSSLN